MTRNLIRFDSPFSADDWSAIDDRVMGGLSASRLRCDGSGHAVFEGEVRLERGGGFASVRSRPMDLAAPAAKAYVLDVLGDGRRYKFNLRTDDGFDGLSYQAPFNPPAGHWAVIRLPVADFSATFRGRKVPGAPPLDPASVRQVGFVIADKQAGTFSLAVRSIRAE